MRNLQRTCPLLVQTLFFIAVTAFLPGDQTVPIVLSSSAVNVSSATVDVLSTPTGTPAAEPASLGDDHASSVDEALEFPLSSGPARPKV